MDGAPLGRGSGVHGTLRMPKKGGEGMSQGRGEDAWRVAEPRSGVRIVQVRRGAHADRGLD